MFYTKDRLNKSAARCDTGTPSSGCNHLERRIDMIDLNELKPILEPLNLSADTIEAIQGLDREVVDNSDEIARLNGELERVNAEWNDRFKAAFFKGEGIPHDHEPEVNEQLAEQTGETINESPRTYEDLFGEE